jgi:hypothetical protein
MGLNLGSILKAAAVYAGVSTGVAWFSTGFAGAGAISVFQAGTAGAFFARSFVTSLVLGALSRTLAKDPEEVITYQDKTVTTKQAIAPRKVIYGQTRVGGTIVYMETTGRNLGFIDGQPITESNAYLHLVIAFAGHEVSAFDNNGTDGIVYFNDESVSYSLSTGVANGGNYSGKAKVQVKLGTDNQTVFSDLDSASTLWTSNHRLRGIACAYIRLEYDANVYMNGIPNISFKINGKKVYDPRTATTVFSQNPALCLADYLCDTRYGLGADYATEIDETALTAAANICDQNITLAAGGTEKRYSLNGTFDTSVAPETVISDMLSAMAGKLVFTNGKWTILAGAYNSPSLTFDEDDLRSGLKIQSLVSRRELFNGVKGTFTSSLDNYIASDFPPVISDTYIAQDNDEEIIKSIQLPFTTSPSMAQRLAKIELLKARQQISLVLPLKLIGLKANVGDVIYVRNTRLGWVDKTFEVVSSTVVFDNDAIGVDLELRETNADIYYWSTSEESAYDASPNTSLPNPFTVGSATNFAWTQDKFFINGLGSLSWTAPTDSLIAFYKLRIVSNEYVSFGPKTDAQIVDIDRETAVYGTSYTITDLPSGYYTAYLTSVNQLGVSGSAVSLAVYIPPPPMIPRVSGLELDLGLNGEAHSLEFTGKDVKLKWRHAAINSSFEINDEEPYGADSGFPDWYLKDYQVEVYNSSDELLRQEFTQDNSYIYSLEKNLEDAKKQGDSVYRTLKFKVYARGRQNQLSDQAAIL